MGLARLVLLALPAALVAYISTLPYETEITYGMKRNTTVTPSDRPLDAKTFSRHNVRFESQGVSCDAWLYTPKPRPATAKGDDAAGAATAGAAVAPPYPVVIMGHGLGAQKEFGLDRFAEVFVSAGLAALVFDYRTFGGSDGEPRHWVSPRRHIEDWRAAYQFVKDGGLGPDHDGSRIALWGTSFAGGHVLVLAAELGEGIKGVVSLVPYLDGLENAKTNLQRRGVLGVLRLIATGAHDALRAAMGLKPEGAYVRLLGPPGDLAFMQLSEEEIASYYSKHPKVYQGGWQPRVLARLALEGSRYRPIASVPHIRAPVMLVSALQDSLCPHVLVDGAAAALQEGARGPVLRYNASHFDMYRGPVFVESSKRMAAFLAEQLLAGSYGGRAGAAAADAPAVEAAAAAAA